MRRDKLVRVRLKAFQGSEWAQVITPLVCTCIRASTLRFHLNRSLLASRAHAMTLLAFSQRWENVNGAWYLLMMANSISLLQNTAPAAKKAQSVAPRTASRSMTQNAAEKKRKVCYHGH
jgi:hypothetical protein